VLIAAGYGRGGIPEADSVEDAMVFFLV